MLNVIMNYDKINGDVKYINPNKICGIYCIYNTDYFYVGQSNNIKSRWNSHRNKLKKGTHDNYIIQQIYDKKTNEDPFQYKIICECEEKDLDKLEIIIKDKLSEKYPNKICMNIANCGHRVTWTDEMKMKASISHKGKKIPKEVRNKISESQKGKNKPLLYKKIVQLDLKGNVIKIWNSLKDAEKEYGKIMYNRKSCHGYQWQRYDDWKVNAKKSPEYIREKKIYQFSKETKQLIGEYKSIQQAADILKLDRSSIHKALAGKLKTCGNYLWSYTNQCPNVNLNRNPRKTLPVYQYDLNMNLIKIWIAQKKHQNVLEYLKVQ